MFCVEAANNATSSGILTGTYDQNQARRASTKCSYNVFRFSVIVCFSIGYNTSLVHPTLTQTRTVTSEPKRID